MKVKEKVPDGWIFKAAKIQNLICLTHSMTLVTSLETK